VKVARDKGPSISSDGRYARHPSEVSMPLGWPTKQQKAKKEELPIQIVMMWYRLTSLRLHH
jgi:hypothetical protein